MKLIHKKPCNECPWRRKHPAGWLGGYKAEQFVEQVQRDGPPLPCHKTIFDGQPAKAMCAGALIFMKNTCKSAQHPEYGDAREQVERDTETVFQWSKEFLDHHNDPDAWVASAAEKIRSKGQSNGGATDE